MKRSGTLTTPITGLLVAVLLVGMGVTKAKAQSFFRQTGIQLLTKQEGLSNNTLTEIYQDKDGFLWLGTDVGLSRYDGIHFHNYNSASKEPHSITGIYETSDKMIWSRITNLNTLSCFDKMRGCYMPLTSSTPEVLEDIHDLCVVKDRIYAITSQGAVELKAEYEIDKMNITPAPLPNIKGTPSKFYG
nr:two-component regulator propeller domain-containing protein [uncultured Phocaeicola sp.]